MIAFVTPLNDDCIRPFTPLNAELIMLLTLLAFAAAWFQYPRVVVITPHNVCNIWITDLIGNVTACHAKPIALMNPRTASNLEPLLALKKLPTHWIIDCIAGCNAAHALFKAERKP